MTVKDFIRINIKEHPKLKSTSQFYPNTKVQVFKKCIPEDESAEATKQKENPLKRKKPDDDSLRENALNKREAILKEKEKAVKEKEKDVKEKEKALEIRERILENKEKILKNDLHIVKRERDIVDTQTIRNRGLSGSCHRQKCIFTPKKIIFPAFRGRKRCPGVSF